MRNEIIWTKTATKDINSIIEYISFDSENRAFSLKYRIIYLIDNLVYFPRLEKLLYKLKNFEIRKLTFKKYEIYYVIENDSIKITRIKHSSSN